MHFLCTIRMPTCEKRWGRLQCDELCSSCSCLYFHFRISVPEFDVCNQELLARRWCRCWHFYMLGPELPDLDPDPSQMLNLAGRFRFLQSIASDGAFGSIARQELKTVCMHARRGFLKVKHFQNCKTIIEIIKTKLYHTCICLFRSHKYVKMIHNQIES